MFFVVILLKIYKNDIYIKMKNIIQMINLGTVIINVFTKHFISKYENTAEIIGTIIQSL